jgi:hypothetical protein
MRPALRVGRNIGAAIGAIAFLAVGLAPGFYFGSFGTITVLSHLFGEALQGTVFVRAAVVVGTMMGIFCMASVSIVVGAVFGTILGWVTELLSTESPSPLTGEGEGGGDCNICLTLPFIPSRQGRGDYFPELTLLRVVGYFSLWKH